MPTVALDPDRPRGTTYWARRWRVTRDRARAVLRILRKRYGSKVVWEVPQVGGKSDGRPRLVASERSLQVARVHRAPGDTIVVVLGAEGEQPTTPGRQRSEPEEGEEPVTQDQLQRALSEVWEAVRELRARR